MKHNYETANGLLWQQLHSGLKSVGQWIQHKMKSNDGFSLVEAIVSVVILGLAIVPISMVFTQTVHQTVDTRRQLEANELAQYYVEALKSRSFDDYYVLFAGGLENTFNETTNMTTYNMADVPENYQVKIYMETAIDLEAYKLPSINAAEPVDAIITIGSDASRTLEIANGIGSLKTSFLTSTTTYDRRIEVDAERATNSVDITYYEGTVAQTSYNFGLTDNAIRFVMGDTQKTGSYDIAININSNVTSELKINIYEGKDDSIHTTTAVESGLVSVSRNLKTVDPYTHRIVELRVEVYDTITGDMLASLTGTKIDE